MYPLQNHLANNLASCLFFQCFIYTSFFLSCRTLCCVFFNDCSLWSFRDGVGTHGVGSAGDGSTAGSGSGSGSSSGPEQHLPSTCHPHHGYIFQSSSSAGESLQKTHDSPHPAQHLMASMTTQCATSWFRSALFL